MDRISKTHSIRHTKISTYIPIEFNGFDIEFFEMACFNFTPDRDTEIRDKERNGIIRALYTKGGTQWLIRAYVEVRREGGRQHARSCDIIIAVVETMTVENQRSVLQSLIVNSIVWRKQWH